MTGRPDTPLLDAYSAGVDERRAAVLAFGGVDRHQEAMRDGRGTRWFEDLVRDTRYAARVLLRNPGYTLAIVFTLALAIGTNASVFSAVNGLVMSAASAARAATCVAAPVVTLIV